VAACVDAGERCASHLLGAAPDALSMAVALRLAGPAGMLAAMSVWKNDGQTAETRMPNGSSSNINDSLSATTPALTAQ
jgi:hypothetical protein